MERDDRPSSIAAEQIEALVRQRLDAYPDLADTVLDFGTEDDGTVDVWVNQQQFDISPTSASGRRSSRRQSFNR